MKNSLSQVFVFGFLLLFSSSMMGQSLVALGEVFLPQDSIEFTYESPNYDPADWIGIYPVDAVPGDDNSSEWRYIPDAAGSIYVFAPDAPGLYHAFLLCCDSYDTIAISGEFEIIAPLLEPSAEIYLQGQEIVLSYYSPKFSETDWIGIYESGGKPGDENPSIDWQYITAAEGQATFTTSLDPGMYDAYLLCCGGYDSISACTFEVVASTTPFVKAKSASFEAGKPIEIMYNDPDFDSEDWVGIYKEGDDPAMVSSVAYQYVSSQTGTLSFPGPFEGGNYVAYLFCCNSIETIYAESDVFEVKAGAAGTYVKTSASVYPEGVDILVNYRNLAFSENDWIGIYNKGETPDGDPESIVWTYISSDSGTVTFAADDHNLWPGDYTVFMLCCDSYDLLAKYDFKVGDENTPTLVADKLKYTWGDDITFTYNSPDWVDTDWIGIYNPGETPGGTDTYSTSWLYIPEASGTAVFEYGEGGPENGMQLLAPGEYWAGLFCCDGYDLYASVEIIVGDPNSAKDAKLASKVRLYPNPSDGNVTLSVAYGESIESISVHSLAGRLVYLEEVKGGLSEMSLDLNFLGKGMYLLSTRTGNGKMTEILIIQ